MTHLCVPIFVTDLAMARRDVEAAVVAGADLVELRVDKLDAILTLLDTLLERQIWRRSSRIGRRAEGGFSDGEPRIGQICRRIQSIRTFSSSIWSLRR